MVQSEFYPGFDPIPVSSDAINIATLEVADYLPVLYRYGSGYVYKRYWSEKVS